MADPTRCVMHLSIARPLCGVKGPRASLGKAASCTGHSLWDPCSATGAAAGRNCACSRSCGRPSIEDALQNAYACPMCSLQTR